VLVCVFHQESLKLRFFFLILFARHGHGPYLIKTGALHTQPAANLSPKTMRCMYCKVISAIHPGFENKTQLFSLLHSLFVQPQSKTNKSRNHSVVPPYACSMGVGGFMLDTQSDACVGSKPMAFSLYSAAK
jgi:hypothetical protein